MTLRALAARRIVTCDPARETVAGELGAIEDGVIVLDGDRIVHVGRLDRGHTSLLEAVIEDVGERVITPGLIDAHTHACWVGSRHAEYALRMAGRSYLELAKGGGGIMATARAVAIASEDDLVESLSARLARMAAAGATTIEVKSGYGLEAAQERKQLVAIARVRGRADLPDVLPTLLALHALPEGANRTAYVAGIAATLVPEVGREHLARFVDLYVDAGAFRPDEARTVGEAARRAGLAIRMHVGQFADVGGAQLAAELGASSVDHVEHISLAGMQALARAGVCAVLLPVASFTLDQRAPPVQALRDAGVRLVVASDANPGTAPTESLPLALALAVRSYGFSAAEALRAATRDAAFSLGLDDRGILRPGARADLVVWDLPHEQAIVQPWGVSKTHEVIAGGRTLHVSAGHVSTAHVSGGRPPGR